MFSKRTLPNQFSNLIANRRSALRMPLASIGMALIWENCRRLDMVSTWKPRWIARLPIARLLDVAIRIGFGEQAPVANAGQFLM